MKKKQELFVTLSLLLLASIFCRLPFPVIGIVGFTSASKIDYFTWEIINAILALLLYVNFLVDPVIQFLRIKELKNELRKPWEWIVMKCTRRNNVNLQRNDTLLPPQAVEHHELQEIRHVDVIVHSSSTPLNARDMCFL